MLRHTNPAPDLEFWKLPVVSGNLKIVKLLVETGGRELLMFCDFQGTCLHAASRSFKEGTLQVVQFLLQEGGRELLLKTTSDGLTCLHIAANVYLRPTCIIVVRVGREEEGVSSLRAELAAIARALQAAPAERDLLYLCDSEAALRESVVYWYSI